jgi:hypothetical protein
MSAKFLAPLGEPIEPVLHHIEGILRFQARNDQVCEPPQNDQMQIASANRGRDSAGTEKAGVRLEGKVKCYDRSLPLADAQRLEN